MPSKSPAQAPESAHVLACIACGVLRHYSRRDVDRGRARERCQKCATRAAARARAKRTPADIQAYQATYYKLNRNKLDKYNRDYCQARRLELIAAYGGCCTKCGEADPIVLTLDHIYDDGAHERRTLKAALALIRKLKTLGWLKERHQLLCCNCNQRKEYYRRQNAVRLC